MTPPRRRRQAPRAWTTAVVCAGLFMLGMDVTILNVAVPGLRQDLPATTAQVQWIVDGYALVLGGTVLSVGAFTDTWGRRRSFVSGVVLCGAASWAGAVAGEPWQLIAARCGMGAGAALLMPATLAVIHHIFPEAALRARAIAVWAAVGGLGGSAGRSSAAGWSNSSPGGRRSGSTSPSPPRSPWGRSSWCPSPARNAGRGSTAWEPCSRPPVCWLWCGR